MREKSQSRFILLLVISLIMIFSTFINIRRVNTYKAKNEALKRQLNILQQKNQNLNSERNNLDKKYNDIKQKTSSLKGI